MKTPRATRHVVALCLALAAQAALAQRPSISGFSPRLGRAGDTITVTGQSFNTTANLNIVFFGASRATAVLDAGQPGTQLRAIVPPGATYERLTVTNSANSLTGYSSLLFLPRFFGTDNIAFDSLRLRGPSRNSVLIDVNADRLPDLASTAWLSATSTHGIGVYPNTTSLTGGTPSFGTVQTSSIGASGYYNIGRGDFDGDGDLDAVILGETAPNLALFLNNGTSLLFSTTFPVTGSNRRGLAVADMNNDGRPDVVVADRGNGTTGFIRILTRTAAGGFTEATRAVNNVPWEVAVADLDLDGLPDIIYPESANGGGRDTIGVLRNLGGGNYAAPFRVKLTNGLCCVTEVEVGDFDSDGLTDLAFVHNYGAVSFVRNTTSGTVLNLQYVSTSTFGTSLEHHCIADVNGDGKPDVVVMSSGGGGRIHILRNTSSGSISFAAPSFIDIGNTAVSTITAGDLNSDGKPELIFAGGQTSNSNLNVLRNVTPNAPAASITVRAGTPQSAQVNTPFATALQATVRDASGNPVQGVIVTFTPPVSGASGSFAGGVNTATTNFNGIATAMTFTANTIAGSYVVNATVAGVASPAQFALTNTAGPAASIAPSAGTPQSAQVNMPYTLNFQVVVRDQFGNPVPNSTVTWTPPGSGASGSFAGGANTALTNASGVATAAAFTANTTAGSFTLPATVSGVGSPANFLLTNLSGLPASVVATAGTPQNVVVNTAFPTNLQVVVGDQFGNGVQNVTVTWTPAGSGPSGTFQGGANTAVTNASGVAVAATFTANTTAGSYLVPATVSGVG